MWERERVTDWCVLPTVKVAYIIIATVVKPIRLSDIRTRLKASSLPETRLPHAAIFQEVSRTPTESNGFSFDQATSYCIVVSFQKNIKKIWISDYLQLWVYIISIRLRNQKVRSIFGLYEFSIQSILTSNHAQWFIGKPRPWAVFLRGPTENVCYIWIWTVL